MATKGALLRLSDGAWHGTGTLQIVHNGRTQIDGTSFVAYGPQGVGAYYQYNGGQPLDTGSGSREFTASGAGKLYVTGDNNVDGDYVTENVQLLVTVAGAAFTINAVLDVNTDDFYCRVSTEVQTAVL